MSHEPDDEYTDWDERVRAIYRDVIDGAGDEGMTRAEAIKHVIAQVEDEIRAGALTVPADAAVRRTVEVIDHRDSSLAERVLSKARDGQESMLDEDDPFLMTTATLGGGRRKTWRWVTRTDLMDMDRLRWHNVKSQRDAYDRWRNDYDAWLPVLDRYQFFGDAIDAGAIPDPDDR